MRSALLIIVLAISGQAWAQAPIDVVETPAAASTEFANTITADELKAHLEVLASDAFEGRETGKRGQKLAAEYIARQFKMMGIPELETGGYYQTVELEQVQPGGAKLAINGTTYEYLKDYYFFRGSLDTSFTATEVAFCGYGIDADDYDDYKGYDVEGKVVMVLDGEPENKKGIKYASGTKRASVWGQRWRMKGKEAASRDATAILIVVDDMKSKLARVKKWAGKPSLQQRGTAKEKGKEKKKKKYIPAVYITRTMANRILAEQKQKVEKLQKKIEKTGKTIHIKSKAEVAIAVATKKEDVEAENVLGFIEGTDLKDEVVIITAHYDHIGINADGEINNGADDDGSGTACALEIAQAFVKAKEAGKGPRRSVLVMTVSGEEKGLLGSEYYANNPVYPLENTVCDLNIDMVGRKDAEHEDENYIYLIGSDKLSTDLHRISEEANDEFTNLALDYTFNDPDDPNRYYYRSDHYNFAKNDIPVIFYFSGVHEDYHKPTDTVEKILFDKTAVVAKLVFHTAWKLANQDERIKVDVENDFKEK